MKQIYPVVSPGDARVLRSTHVIEDAMGYADGEGAVVLNSEEVLLRFTLPQLAQIYNQLNPAADLKRFSSREAAHRRIMKFLAPGSRAVAGASLDQDARGGQDPQPKTKEKRVKKTMKRDLKKTGGKAAAGATRKAAVKKTSAKKAPAKRAVTKKASGELSYTEKLRKIFKAKKTRLTLDEIAEELGCDRRNAGVAVSIAKNPKRTADPVAIERDRADGTYRRVS